MTNTCTFSPCRQYRYTLEHVIDPMQHEYSPRRIMWIGLNPSTADEQQLDPTLRRIRRFSADWGYTAFVMTNLFAYRATDPRDMMAAANPVGPENNMRLLKTAGAVETIVAAWGAHGRFMDREKTVRRMLASVGDSIHCLALTKRGQPKHPLYIGAATKLKPFNPKSSD